MVRTTHCLYKVLLQCLPADWEVKPHLVWHWDGVALAKHIAIDKIEFERENGFSVADILAAWDPDMESVHASLCLAERPIAIIILTLLHELAHANGFDDEKEADDAAFRVFKVLNRKKKFQALGIKLSTRRRDKTSVPDDKVFSNPTRLVNNQPAWVTERY